MFKAYSQKRRTRLRTWAKRDTNDTRKIHYIFVTWDNRTIRANSDMTYGEIGLTPQRLGDAWIDTIELKNNEWYISVYED